MFNIHRCLIIRYSTNMEYTVITYDTFLHQFVFGGPHECWRDPAKNSHRNFQVLAVIVIQSNVFFIENKFVKIMFIASLKCSYSFTYYM